MPNTDSWTLLILLVLWIISLIICYLIFRSIFNSKLEMVKKQSDYVLENTQSELHIRRQEVKELNSQLTNLSNEKRELDATTNRLFADSRNLKNRLEDSRVEIHELKQQIKIEQQAKSDISVKLAQANSQNDNLNQRLIEERKQLDELNQKFSLEFENLAQKILEEKSEKFTSKNKENLETILNPLQEKIRYFEKRVEDTHKESIAHGARLQQQIIGLKELNQQMTQEANNLTRALKGESKTQGNWGEMILESVLEKSGLQKGLEYEVQSSHRNDEGRKLMPDVIINLPGNKKMIIDAKVSLTAYEKYINENEIAEKPGLLKAHIHSIERHIKNLSNKKYHNIYPMDSPDFVLLFIPIESAFAVASQEKPNLYQDAFEQDIILVTPTTLLAVLRTIDSMWQNEKQKQNAIDIATQAGKLYDTFVNLLEELEKVGRQMDTAKGSYDTAMKKLTGNRSLFKNIQKLKSLGAKTRREIDEKYIRSVDNNNEDDEMA